MQVSLQCFYLFSFSFLDRDTVIKCKKKKNSQWISLFTNKTKFSSWIIFFVIQTKHFSFSNPFLRRRTNINFVRHGEKKRCIFIKDTLTLKKLKGMIAKKNSKNNYMQIKWNIKNYKDIYTPRKKKFVYKLLLRVSKNQENS